MILFYNDWNDYPSATPDTQTKNKSFLRMALLYKQRGIKNHAFMLALHDPVLQGVDPHSEELDEITILRIVRECKTNPWYYFREVLRMPQTGSEYGVSFKANRYNLAIIWLYFNHVATFGITIRQIGKSMTAIGIYSGLLSLWTKSDVISLITKDNGLRVKTVEQLKDVIDLLPYYLQLRTRTDAYNTEAISIGALKNKFVSNVAQSSIAGALKIGRGSTTATSWVDEIAYIVNIDQTLPAALAGSGAARDNAKINGTPYGTMYTTTAGYLNTPSGIYAKDLYDNGMDFTELIFDIDNETELYRVIRKNSKDHTLLVIVEFNHRQLGKSDEWLKQKIEDSRAKGDAIRADFFNQWITGGSTSPIPKNILEYIKASIVDEPNTKLSKTGYLIKWYITDAEIERYKYTPAVIGSDTSDAVGRDDITIAVRDIKNASVIMTMMCNETNTLDFADFVIEILLEYRNFVLIMERKLNGGTIIDHLLRILPTYDIDPFKRLFNFVVHDMGINNKYKEMLLTPLKDRDNSVYTIYRKQFGYPTSGGGRASRDNLYGTNLLNSCKYSGRSVRDSVLINQILSLVTKNNRIDHSSGNHDDMVIAWLLGYYFLTQADNIEYYGINQRDVLSTMYIHSDDPKDIFKLKRIKEQEGLKEEILNMLDTIHKVKNDLIIRKLMFRVRRLNNKLDEDVKNKFNINARLQEIEDMKELKKKKYWER